MHKRLKKKILKLKLVQLIRILTAVFKKVGKIVFVELLTTTKEGLVKLLMKMIRRWIFQS